MEDFGPAPAFTQTQLRTLAEMDSIVIRARDRGAFAGVERRPETSYLLMFVRLAEGL